MQVSTLFLRALCLDLRDQGIPAEDFWSRFELTPLTGHYVLVDSSTLAEAIRVALQAGAHPSLALRLGSTVALRALGMFGQLLLQCPTARDALAAAQRFMPLLQPGAELLLTESGAMAALHYDSALEPGKANQFATEMVFALAVTVARRFVGERACPQGVLLPFDPPEHREPYDEVFRCPIVFGAHRAALMFDSSMLDVRQPFSDPRLLELLETELSRILARIGRDVPLHARVRMMLEQRIDSLTWQKMPDLSRMLGLSRRAIRRHLAAEGQTYSRVFQKFRREQALRLLEDEGLPLKDIAETMGYSDPSAFHRAFRRWTGETPRQFRMSLRGRTPASGPRMVRVSSGTRAQRDALPS